MRADADLLMAVLVSHGVFVTVVVTIGWAAGEAIQLLLGPGAGGQHSPTKGGNVRRSRTL